MRPLSTTRGDLARVRKSAKRLHEKAVGADAASLGGYAESLAAIKDWTFKPGLGLVVGIGNGLVLGYLMLSSGLMPRWLALIGVNASRTG